MTTGTSTGFGRSAAENLAQRGYRVFGTMRDTSGRHASTVESLRALARQQGCKLRVFDGASSAPETPSPEGVVEAFVRLIETPAGARPFRTVPTAAIQQLLEPYNALAETIRDVIARAFKAPELTVFQPSGSAGV